jgi:putative endonuclease
VANHNRLGREGESLAAAWLRQNGFVVLHQNWRFARVELDIVAVRDGVLHFIEVKTRRSLAFGEPEESVSRGKLRHLLKAGAAYQYEYPQWKRVQYNVLSIHIDAGNTPAYFFIEDVYL